MDKYERKIISGIKCSDRQVFRELFDTYYTKLFLYAKSYVDNDMLGSIYDKLDNYREATNEFKDTC